MNRFAFGLVFGAAGTAIAYAAGLSVPQAAGVGLGVAVAAWALNQPH